MEAAGAHKRSATERVDPLNEAGILQQVLSYVPVQTEWPLFLATVNSLWRSVYSRLDAQEMQRKSFSYVMGITAADFTCVPQMTLYSSVFASPSRVHYAHESGMKCSRVSYQYAAGRHATVTTIITARDVGMDYSAATMTGVADCNTLPVMQFLHAQGCPWDETVTSAAAARSDLEILRWASEHGCDWNERAILSEAASSGNVELTAWVKQQPGVVCNEDAMDAAAQKGHTAVCEYLRAQQCPWSAQTCFGAAASGHVHTLRWLHEHGCPWNAVHTCEAAAAGGFIDVMQYLLQHDIAYTPALLTLMLNAAGACNKLAAAQWLRQQGAEWPDVLYYLISRWSGETLAWARAKGCTSPTQ
jgi:hypothetical protein